MRWNCEIMIQEKVNAFKTSIKSTLLSKWRNNTGVREFLKTQQKKKQRELDILEMVSLKITSQYSRSSLVMECGWTQNNDPPKSASYLLIELRDKHQKRRKFAHFWKRIPKTCHWSAARLSLSGLNYNRCLFVVHKLQKVIAKYILA